MPISGYGSYPEVMLEFIDHWTPVNAALGGTPQTDLKLPGGYTLANFTTDRADIVLMLSNLLGYENAWQGASFDRDTLRSELRRRVLRFRDTVAVFTGNSRYVRMLPDTPQETSSSKSQLQAFDDMQRVWASVNADTDTPDFTPPLILQGGYTLANFTANVTLMRQRFDAAAVADHEWQKARADRDQMLRDALARMQQYRAKVVVMLPEDDPLLNTVPSIYAEPGSTPDAVNLSAAWNSQQQQVVLNWSPSTDSAVAHYSVRYCPSSNWDSNTAQVVSQVPYPLTTFATTLGLTSPGAVALYRVYVVVQTGNERASNVVEVTRPENGAGGGVPAAPGIPTLINATGGQIIVTWTAVAGAVFYNVYRQVVGTDLDYVLVSAATGSPMNISNMPPGETVRVRITAVNANGESLPGPHAEIIIPDATP